jgi:branched-subunit amino acid ABC-type transport system permease component
MTFSMTGLIGAAIGLICALGAYVAVVPQLRRSETAGSANPNAAAIRTILLADFVVLAAVGYYVGQLYG